MVCREHDLEDLRKCNREIFPSENIKDSCKIALKNNENEREKKVAETNAEGFAGDPAFFKKKTEYYSIEVLRSIHWTPVTAILRKSLIFLLENIFRQILVKNNTFRRYGMLNTIVC